MNNKILITGATGNVGYHLAKQLYEARVPLVAGVRTAASGGRLPTADFPTVRFDFGDRSSYREAFEGVEKLFLLRPPQISDVAAYLKPVIDYAAQVGVEQIVFLSLLGAERNKVVPHHKVEQWLIAGTVPYTLLRAGFFMQNLDTTHRMDIAEYDELFIPAGQGRTAFVDTRDIAAVAAKTLTEAGHHNKAYALTGAEALTYGEVAEIFTTVLGREIRYPNPSLPRFAWRMRQYGHAWGYIAVMTAIYTTTKLGMAATVTTTVEQLLGRRPRAMHAYIKDYADCWQKKTVPH